MLVYRWFARAASLAAVAVLSVAFVGCEAPKPAAPAKEAAHEHSHDDLAVHNYAESVGTLRKLHDEIKTAFEAGKPDDGHDALHKIGHVLEALEKQISEVAADKQESANAAVKALFDSYTKIDEAMHHSEEVKYADMSEELSKNVAALEAAK